MPSGYQKNPLRLRRSKFYLENASGHQSCQPLSDRWLKSTDYHLQRTEGGSKGWSTSSVIQPNHKTFTPYKFASTVWLLSVLFVVFSQNRKSKVECLNNLSPLWWYKLSATSLNCK
ncbi:hypothetical protein HZ326_12541 [Fusarium oxysporum f. sp. albedinis]|nr:hypothetical protein HZ326_12541 [Fusarium oxysporum f. sp. albedinis]